MAVNRYRYARMMDKEAKAGLEKLHNQSRYKASVHRVKDRFDTPSAADKAILKGLKKYEGAKKKVKHAAKKLYRRVKRKSKG